MKSILLILTLITNVVVWAENKPKQSDAHALQKVEIPDLKTAEVCLATTQDNGDRMDWVITCLDSKRHFLVRERHIATEKTAADDEMTYGDLELTVEMQNRGFHLASTQDGLFFTRK